MYKVDLWTNSVDIEKINISKVTEKTVLTDKGSRYYKKCQSYEIFDSFNIALICAKNRTKRHIENLEIRITGARKDLKMFSSLTESDLKY